MKKLIYLLPLLLMGCEKEDINSYQQNNNNIPTSYGYYTTDTSKLETFRYTNFNLSWNEQSNNSIITKNNISDDTITITRQACYYINKWTYVYTIQIPEVYKFYTPDTLLQMNEVSLTHYLNAKFPNKVEIEYLRNNSFKLHVVDPKSGYIVTYFK